MSIKDCEYPGCDRQTPDHRFLCARHWGTVPYALRRAIVATWNARLDAAGTANYREAVTAHEAAKRDAIAAVREVVR